MLKQTCVCLIICVNHICMITRTGESATAADASVRAPPSVCLPANKLFTLLLGDHTYIHIYIYIYV